jgi:hypothetical protein
MCSLSLYIYICIYIYIYINKIRSHFGSSLNFGWAWAICRHLAQVLCGGSSRFHCSSLALCPLCSRLVYTTCTLRPPNSKLCHGSMSEDMASMAYSHRVVVSVLQQHPPRVPHPQRPPLPRFAPNARWGTTIPRHAYAESALHHYAPQPLGM